MYALHNGIRRYAWGSQTAMAEFLGRPSPSPDPEAELWIGAYPSTPSRLEDGTELQALIASDPEGVLGTDALRRFGPRLPFLMKVLTIGAPLSLQAHPNADQAAKGFAGEQTAGLTPEDPVRNYRDPRHKPELLCALTPVEALSGFRVVPETIALLDELGCTELTRLRTTVAGSGLAQAVRWIFMLPAEDVADMVAAAGAAAAMIPAGEHSQLGCWIARLATDYPADRGVILALLCNYVRLEPGEALSIPVGCLHGYLSGMGVEIMAASDNVLRGGLTAKHVDLEDLSRILDVREGPPLILRPQPDEQGRTLFPVGAEEFELIRFDLTGRSQPLSAQRPAVVLTVSGRARLNGVAGSLELPRGRAAFVDAAEDEVSISGPAVVFQATPGRDAADR